MKIAFFGHSCFQASEALAKQLVSLLECVTGEREVEFYLGGYGEFDAFALECCKTYRSSHKNASLVFVTPYITHSYQKRHGLNKVFDYIIYPEIEDKPKRFAITYRNRWMVESADFVICAISQHRGGAYQAFRYAVRLGKPIYNLLLTPENGL